MVSKPDINDLPTGKLNTGLPVLMSITKKYKEA